MLTGEGFWEGADWSPDGTKIALFGTETGSKQTFIINPDSTRKYEIAWNTTYAHWSPDGKRLATTIGTWDDQLQKWLRDVYVISADGSNLQRLTYDGNKSLDDWSLVGDKMLYLFQPEGMVNPLAYGLGVMSANGLQEKVLVQVDENHGIVLGSFSPDGKKIAYVKNSFTTDEEPSALWVMDADGSNQRKLDGHSVPRLIFYDWSPK
jgi:Tol biopolymer transport system component